MLDIMNTVQSFHDQPIHVSLHHHVVEIKQFLPSPFTEKPELSAALRKT